jgi:group I intron endonuclease
MYYIGCHQTADLNDGYLGSGKHLKRAIKKYGQENFKFEVLYSVPTKEQMFRLEQNIVNESLVKDPLTYNLKIGGSGGNPGIVGAFKGKKHSEETKEKIRQASLQQVTTDVKRKKLSVNNAMKNDPEIRKKVSDTLTGRVCSDTHRKRVSDANLGKILINNGIIAKRIPKDELAKYKNTEWSKGGLPRKRKSR